MIDRKQLEFLARTNARNCVSIFLPTHRAGPATQQDPIRLKNLVEQAAAKLKTAGMRAANVRERLTPVREFVRRAGFWRNQDRGLAIFAADGYEHTLQLPFEVPEGVFVMDHFEIAPLVRAFLAGGAFHVLALSHNRVRLFDGTPDSFVERDMAGVPRSVDEALRYDVRESQLQMHSAVGGRAFGRHAAAAGADAGGQGLVRSMGKEAAVYTGQGVGVDDEEARTEQFLLMVEKGVRRLVRNGRTPLVLAGVTELQAEYRRINKYLRLVEEGITGNPDRLRNDELYAAAIEIMGPLFENERMKAIDKFREFAGSPKRSTDLKEILIAAYQGRIESLFLVEGTRKWGSFDFEEEALRLTEGASDGNEELFNLAAVETILTRGDVYPLARDEMADGCEIAAVFRFSVAPAESPRT